MRKKGRASERVRVRVRGTLKLAAVQIVDPKHLEQTDCQLMCAKEREREADKMWKCKWNWKWRHEKCK